MTKEYLESSHAAADGYRSYLVERYQGEVYGEALFQAMAAGCNDAERVGKLCLLEPPLPHIDKHVQVLFCIS